MVRSEAERNEQEIGAEQEEKRDGALRGVVHVKSSWREEEVYVASGNHFSVVHGARGCVSAPSLVWLQVSGLRAHGLGSTRASAGQDRVPTLLGKEEGLICCWVGQEPQCGRDFKGVFEIVKVNRASAGEQRTDSTRQHNDPTAAGRVVDLGGFKPNMAQRSRCSHVGLLNNLQNKYKLSVFL